MSPFFCSTCALSLEVCALARVMKMARSAHQPIRAWLMNSPPLSQSSPSIGYGSRSATSSIAATTRVWARLRMAMFSVQPVYTSVAVNVHACSPLRLCPQCATRSISKKPGAFSIPSIA